MTKIVNHFISLLIVILMILAMLPAGVFAEEAAPAPEAPAAAEEAPADADEPEVEPEDEPEKEPEEEPEVEPEDEPEDEPEEEPEDELEEKPEDEPAPTVVEDTNTEEASLEVTVVEDENTEEAAPAAPAVSESASSEDDVKEYDPARTGYVSSGADVYAEADDSSELIFTTDEDMEFSVTAMVNGEWYEVDLDEDTYGSSSGYICKDDVSFDEPVQDEPAVTVADDDKSEEAAATIVEDEKTEEVAATVVEDEKTEEPAVTVVEDNSTEELTEIEDYETPLGLVSLTEDADTSEYTGEDSFIPTAVKVGANVRTEPDGMSPIIVTVTEDTMLEVLAQVDDDWYAVLLAEEVEGYEFGYVYKDDVILNITVVEEEKSTEPAEGDEEELPKKVTIFTSRRVVMEEGENVTLTSKLEGFDGLELKYIWKVDKGEGFEEMEGANESTYVFEATAETLSWGWHLTVLYR